MQIAVSHAGRGGDELRNCDGAIDRSSCATMTTMGSAERLVCIHIHSSFPRVYIWSRVRHGISRFDFLLYMLFFFFRNHRKPATFVLTHLWWLHIHPHPTHKRPLCGPHVHSGHRTATQCPKTMCASGCNSSLMLYLTRQHTSHITALTRVIAEVPD